MTGGICYADGDDSDALLGPPVLPAGGNFAPVGGVLTQPDGQEQPRLVRDPDAPV